jgi:hypothetical protein
MSIHRRCILTVLSAVLMEGGGGSIGSAEVAKYTHAIKDQRAALFCDPKLAAIFMHVSGDSPVALNTMSTIRCKCRRITIESSGSANTARKTRKKSDSWRTETRGSAFPSPLRGRVDLR